MIRSPAEISSIMPTDDSSTRMEYSNIRRDGSDRNSRDTISVTDDPASARIFRKRAKSSRMKLPPNVTSLPAGTSMTSAPVSTSSTTDSPVTRWVESALR